MTEVDPDADREAALKRGQTTMVRSASRWMQDALTAWAEDDFPKVATLAPLAVEHLGKAALWNANPALLVPLSQDAEASLFILVERPDLTASKLRTIGLKIVLGRLDTLLGGLPIDPKQRTRMVDIRNGAMHVGSAEQSRYVLIDALTLCVPLLARLGTGADWFYGDHKANADGLLKEKRTEVGHQVAAKRAKARMLLKRLEDQLEPDVFEEVTSSREDAAEYNIDPNDFGFGDMYAIAHDCPECGSGGRLIGSVDVTHEVDYEQVGVDDFVIRGDYYFIDLIPSAFACNVCKLTLHGQQELAACDLPSSRMDVQDHQLGPDFDPRTAAEAMYGPPIRRPLLFASTSPEDLLRAALSASQSPIPACPNA